MVCYHSSRYLFKIIENRGSTQGQYLLSRKSLPQLMYDEIAWICIPSLEGFQTLSVQSKATLHQNKINVKLS